MKKGFFGSVAALLASGGVALAQMPTVPYGTNPGPVLGNGQPYGPYAVMVQPAPGPNFVPFQPPVVPQPGMEQMPFQPQHNGTQPGPQIAPWQQRLVQQPGTEQVPFMPQQGGTPQGGTQPGMQPGMQPGTQPVPWQQHLAPQPGMEQIPFQPQLGGTHPPPGYEHLQGYPGPAGPPCDHHCAEPCPPANCCRCECGWAELEYLLWWVRDSHVPALVTTGSTEPTDPGAIGTRVLFGGKIDLEEHNGMRLRVGYWLTPDQSLAIDGGGFWLPKRSVGFQASSPGDPLLARPFFDVFTDTPSAHLVAFPEEQAGKIAIRLSDETWSAEANLRKKMCCNPCWNVSVFAGFRYFECDEALDIQETTTSISPNSDFEGAKLVGADNFTTHNSFYGGQLGTSAEYCFGCLAVGVEGKVALGSMHEIADLEGRTTVTSAVGTTTQIHNGLLTLPSNSGHFARNVFAVVPEVDLHVSYKVNEHVRATAGYSFLYASNVLRPGNLVDTHINTTQIPDPLGNGELIGPKRPAFNFNSTDIWMQGVSVGLEIRF